MGATLLDPAGYEQDPLAALARRVAALENAAGAGATPEETIPTYLTLDAGGHVGAMFTGEISAQGIILPAATSSTPTAVSEIQWVRQSDGAVIAVESAYSEANQEALFLSSIPVPSTDYSTLQLFSGPPGLIGSSNVSINSQGDGLTGDANTEITASAYSTTGLQFNTTIINALGQSSFLQALALTGQQWAWGSSSLGWAGASVNSGGVAVAHNIGRVPSTVILTAGAISDGQQDAIFSYSTRTSSLIFVNARASSHTPANGVTCQFGWICIG